MIGYVIDQRQDASPLAVARRQQRRRRRQVPAPTSDVDVAQVPAGSEGAHHDIGPQAAQLRGSVLGEKRSVAAKRIGVFRPREDPRGAAVPPANAAFDVGLDDANRGGLYEDSPARFTVLNRATELGGAQGRGGHLREEGKHLSI